MGQPYSAPMALFEVTENEDQVLQLIQHTLFIHHSWMQQKCMQVQVTFPQQSTRATKFSVKLEPQN